MCATWPLMDWDSARYTKANLECSHKETPHEQSHIFPGKRNRTSR